jgi:hypothetical protein
VNKPLHKFGLGLRSKHYDHIIEHRPQVDFFEIISENFMNSRGRPREMLDRIRAHYPILTHGVSLSIGSTDPLNTDYLNQLKNFADEIEALHISDHLCWTGIHGKNTHDLLPLPLTEEALNHVIGRVKNVQDILGRRILIENPSTYLTFRADHIPEYEFMAELAKQADCGLLLDVNNVYVSSFNHRLDAQKYIDAIPMERVAQIHLAGHMHKGTHIVDTHDNHVTGDVWDLYRYTISKATHPVNVMVEWDGNIPEFGVLQDELAKAKLTGSSQIKPASINSNNTPSGTNHDLTSLQNIMQDSIYKADLSSAETWIAEKPSLPPEAQLGVYIAAYRFRIHDMLADDYEALRHYLGDQQFAMLVKGFIESNYSEYYDIGIYSEKFANWVQYQNLDLFARELADLEKKTAVVYTLENSPAASAQDFAAISPEDFIELKLRPRTASIFSHYQNNVSNYLSDYQNNEKPKAQPEETYLIIYRKDDKAHRLKLKKAEYELLHQLAAGKTIGEAIETCDPEDFQKWFAKWLNNQLLSL